MSELFLPSSNSVLFLLLSLPFLFFSSMWQIKLITRYLLSSDVQLLVFDRSVMVTVIEFRSVRLQLQFAN